MNVNKLLNTMNDITLSPNDRSGAAARLWELTNKINKNLKSFKDEMIDLSETEGKDLTLISSDDRYQTVVERQPPSPLLDTMDVDTLRTQLGDDLFERFVAHSHTIKWSEFKFADPQVQEQIYNLPGLEVVQTYQVKFKRL